MRKISAVCLFVITVAALSSPARGWDGERKGFVLNLGVGLADATYKQLLSSMQGNATSERESKAAFLTNFEIGYAPSNQVMILYSNVVPWFKFKNVFNSEITMISGVGGLTFAYFFRPQAPSFFVGGGLGLASWSAPFENNSDSWTSLGFLAKAGYEIGRNVNLTFHLLGGSPSKTVYGVTGKTNTFSAGVTINWMGY